MDTIYIDSDEELTSIIEKLQRSGASEVNFSCPKGAMLFQSIINLKILSKEAKKFGKIIGLVTTDDVIKNLAGQVGIKVFEPGKEGEAIAIHPRPQPKTENVIEIDRIVRKDMPKVVHFQKEKKIVEVIKKEPQKPIRPKKRLTLILLLIFILLLVGFGYFILPKATVFLQVVSESFATNFKIIVDKNLKVIDPINSIIPGTELNLTKEISKQYPATGQKKVGTAKASGKITINNYWDSNPQTISKGSNLSSSGLKFVSLQDVTVPGASISQGAQVPGQAEVSIEAAEPGDEYNISGAKFTITSLPADKQAKIYGTSSGSLTGGKTVEKKIVSDNDIKKAREEIEKEIIQQSKTELESKNPGKKVITEAISVDLSNFNTSKKSGEEADDFEATADAKVKALAFKDADFRQVIAEKSKEKVPEGKEILIKPDDDITVKASQIDFNIGKMDLEGNINSQIVLKIDQGKLKKDIQGQSSWQAEENLQKSGLYEDARVNVWPDWWFRKVPFLQQRIKIEIEVK